MSRFHCLLRGFTLVGLSLFISSSARAIPGQSAESTIPWIRNNAFIRPQLGESLLVKRTDPDGSRFSFQASVIPPGRVITPLDKETIRSERMTFFKPAGLTSEQLVQAIREVYGSDIAADFDQAKEVLRYPSAAVMGSSATGSAALQRAIQGIVRQGEQFIYWLELTQNPDGKVQQGQIVVFQPEFLPKVQAELAQRYNLPVPTP